MPHTPNKSLLPEVYTLYVDVLELISLYVARIRLSLIAVIAFALCLSQLIVQIVHVYLQWTNALNNSAYCFTIWSIFPLLLAP